LVDLGFTQKRSSNSFARPTLEGEEAMELKCKSQDEIAGLNPVSEDLREGLTGAFKLIL